MGGGVISFWSTLLVFVSLKPKTSKCLEAKEVLEQLILYSLPKHNFKTIVRQIFLNKNSTNNPRLCAFKVQKNV